MGIGGYRYGSGHLLREAGVSHMWAPETETEEAIVILMHITD